MEKCAETEYPIHELLARRWSPRAFEPRPILTKDLRSLLEAVRWSASSFNEQPWRVIVARREDQSAFEAMLGCLMEANRTWATHAGALMIMVAKLTFTRNERPNRVAHHDIGLAAGNLSIQATELGLFIHQMAGIDLDAARKQYSIPEGFEAVTAIAVGYAGKADSLPEGLREMEGAARARHPQSAFVFEGGWDRPAEF
jgi:nitroreductase